MFFLSVGGGEISSFNRTTVDMDIAVTMAKQFKVVYTSPLYSA